MCLPIPLTKWPKIIKTLNKIKSMKRKGHSKPKPQDELNRNLVSGKEFKNTFSITQTTQSLGCSQKIVIHSTAL